MSLRHAVLAALVHGEASGYDLAKHFDAGVANFWHARRQQIYAELTRLHDDGLVQATEVAQRSRPTKRVFSLTEAGVAALETFAAAPKQPTALRDELTVAVQAADVVDAGSLIENLTAEADRARQKLIHFRELERAMLGGRSEELFVRTTRHLGPYLTCRRGILLTADTERWCEWAIGLLRARDRLRGAGAAQEPNASWPTV
jgi:DNA-binding PadR family transcriptional regulator